MKLDYKAVEALREQYPPGTRVRLSEMRDPYGPVPSGSVGTVVLVDDIGTLHTRWDSGRSLGLIPGVDTFSVIELQRVMLYMPLHGSMLLPDEDDEWEPSADPVSGQELRQFKSIIEKALVEYRNPEEAERGVMHWYGEDDGVDAKVRSAIFGVEERADSLWGTVTCMVEGDLTAQELDTLKNYLAGQASDGWGEGFEQQELKTSEGELNVHLWGAPDWRIMTEAEFGQRYEQTPADMTY